MMLDVKKKKRRSFRHGRAWLTLGAVVLALGVGGLALLESRAVPTTVEEDVQETSGVLTDYEASQISRLSITQRSGDSWAAIQSADGVLTLEDNPDYEISADKAADVLDAARNLSYQEILTEDVSAYSLADFGLEAPLLTLDVTYTDGAHWVLHLGDTLSLEENNAYYMLVDGDSRLFALDKGSAEALMVERASLHPVEQPVLHKARFDRITLADGSASTLADWALQGEIGGNAQDRWLLATPLQYPADGDSISSLQDNLVNFRLGAYVGEATPENLTAYGFDTPRLTITIHQAAGSIGSTDTDGVYAVTDWPESTFTLTVGGAKSDMVDYVLVDGSIYISSHFTLEVFLDMDPISTLSRYTVPVALGNLQSLTIRQGEAEAVYTLTRTEQVSENNDLVTDSSGNVVYDVTCDCNGKSVAYQSFESAYNDLLKVTVSGFLPTGWQAAEEPHTTFVFQAVTGESYTLELTRFDALHDAVLLDGNAVFYLIKDGMNFTVK